jgi:molybdopterin converting factor small subunit
MEYYHEGGCIQVLVHVRFDSQVRRLAGCNRISVDVDNSATLQQIVQRVAEVGTEQLRTTLLDDQQSLRSSILVFLNDDLVSKEQRLVLHDGSELTLTTLISGG